MTLKKEAQVSRSSVLSARSFFLFFIRAQKRGLALLMGLSLLCILGSFQISQAKEACDDHWLQGIYEYGSLLQLGDGSLWEVHGLCTGQCKDWKVGHHIQHCGNGKFKNLDLPTEDQVWVHVKQIPGLYQPSRSKP